MFGSRITICYRNGQIIFVIFYGKFGSYGARCTTELKKNMRKKFENAENDVQVFGFDVSEQKRITRFVENNFDVRLYAPLVQHNKNKQDCLNILSQAGIQIPMMYKLGYMNNNCIGCVKGGKGYWNKIRKDFPEVFDKMAKLERKMDVAINKSNSKKREKVFLDELDPKSGRYESELETMKCGLVCGE